MKNIRNFAIIAHIDHGKSTLADRFLELTATVEKRKMREQYLDQMDLERERGITIKLQPVRMNYTTRINADIYADSRGLQYEDITYKVRGAIFNVYNNLGPGHKENIYQNALAEEFKKLNLLFESEKIIEIIYEGKKIGVYRPDFVIDNKIILELKSLPFLGKLEKKQIWHYLKGSNYRLALLVNFGSREVQIKRIIYDNIRDYNIRENPRFDQRKSAYPQGDQRESAFILNLIDTPGHVDFSYEVSRSLAAVEGVVLLVDATKGVQAQTLANLYLAQQQRLAIIPAINKIDLPGARVEEVEEEIRNILGDKIPPSPPLSRGEPTGILKISAKDGLGVPELLAAVVQKVPPPMGEATKPLRALVFDSSYDSFKGVLAYVRVVDGEIRRGEKILLMASGAKSEVLEVGIFKPNLVPTEKLSAGEIGYIATGLKEVGLCRVGDTITSFSVFQFKSSSVKPLAGYKEPRPMIFASFYPAAEADFDHLKDSLNKLKLSDASLVFEPESSEALGRGFKCGFLGMLHMEIVSERLRREYGLNLIVTTPSVVYKMKSKSSDAEKLIYSPQQLPDASSIAEIREPWVKLEVISPNEYLGTVMTLLQNAGGIYKNTQYLGAERVVVTYETPLREIIVDFYDKLKSATSGYASMGYDLIDWRAGDLVALDILVAGDKVEAFSRIVPRAKAQNEGRLIVEKLKEVLPSQWFTVALQAAVGSTILARETIKARRKDVTGYLYGGDVTRKRKLLEKQKKGKKRMMAAGRVNIPQDVFLKVLKK